MTDGPREAAVDGPGGQVRMLDQGRNVVPESMRVGFLVGDVVYVEGASAMLGDVLAVDDDGVRVQWRLKITTEQPDDLERVPEPGAHEAPWQRLEAKQEEQAATGSSQKIDAAQAYVTEVERLRAALRHLAAPNWSVRATGQDARDMASFARQTLDEGGGDERPE